MLNLSYLHYILHLLSVYNARIVRVVLRIQSFCPNMLKVNKEQCELILSMLIQEKKGRKGKKSFVEI